MLDAGSAVAAVDLDLELEAVAGEQVVAGEPMTGSAVLCTRGAGDIGAEEIGVWEMTPGSMRDVESDEVFVVIAGRATVRFDHDGTVLQLGPGTVGRLAAGQRTVWTVTETIRKVYIA
ncbi:cupin domain-containing protein [Lacisediminihabitans profunda]|uniref:Cupin domain-containing protein n=1 Tax=Lacisediminihabitans profunda TaxID=2594790 RepID=A0A5C8UIH3_9MICO|nr:cupin domain-containing protein [Lacisediminihabitans profunda]TXN28113.1 cupin domain-containing protein [Lacisediminihabitans profunda]